MTIILSFLVYFFGDIYFLSLKTCHLNIPTNSSLCSNFCLSNMKKILAGMFSTDFFLREHFQVAGLKI